MLKFATQMNEFSTFLPHWGKVPLERLVVDQLVKKLFTLIEPKIRCGVPMNPPPDSFLSHLNPALPFKSI
jgi:hypothetical protein